MENKVIQRYFKNKEIFTQVVTDFKSLIRIVNNSGKIISTFTIKVIVWPESNRFVVANIKSKYMLNSRKARYLMTLSSIRMKSPIKVKMRLANTFDSE